MKKRKHLIMLILTVSAFTFAGCGNQTDNSINDSSPLLTSYYAIDKTTFSCYCYIVNN